MHWAMSPVDVIDVTQARSRGLRTLSQLRWQSGADWTLISAALDSPGTQWITRATNVAIGITTLLRL
jgi:hypothetical protein